MEGKGLQEKSHVCRIQGQSHRTQRLMLRGKQVAPPEDGHSWRKYGEKQLPYRGCIRMYFRCKHRKALGCSARRTVDFSIDRPLERPPLVEYLGCHNHSNKAVPTPTQDHTSKAHQGRESRLPETRCQYKMTTVPVSRKNKGGDKGLSASGGNGAQPSSRLLGTPASATIQVAPAAGGEPAFSLSTVQGEAAALDFSSCVVASFDFPGRVVAPGINGTGKQMAPNGSEAMHGFQQESASGERAETGVADMEMAPVPRGYSSPSSGGTTGGESLEDILLQAILTDMLKGPPDYLGTRLFGNKEDETPASGGYCLPLNEMFEGQGIAKTSSPVGLVHLPSNDGYLVGGCTCEVSAHAQKAVDRETHQRTVYSGIAFHHDAYDAHNYWNQGRQSSSLQLDKYQELIDVVSPFCVGIYGTN